MIRWLIVLAFVLVGLAPSTARADEKSVREGLTIRWIDTEGGAATLIITPAGESVLIDCGNPGTRDAERVHRAAQEAGLKAIDHVIITHWHLDHYGGVSRLAELMPVHHFWDRGIPANLDHDDPKNFPILIQAYKKATQGQSKALRPGDEVPLKQKDGAPRVRLVCLCASGETIADKSGAPQNPVAQDHQPKPKDTSDNAMSLGFLLSCGDFRFLDLGDLTWNKEYGLVAPTDKIGPIDVYQVTHHGLDISNNPVLIRTVQPRVAVFNNGPRKGGEPAVTTTLRRLPEPPDIYQMHRNVRVSDQENAPAEFIANDKRTGETIQLAVGADGKGYSVTVGSAGKPRWYLTKKK